VVSRGAGASHPSLPGGAAAERRSLRAGAAHALGVDRGAVAGRSTEEAKRMLFEGIEMVARQSGGVVAENPGEVEIWRRVRVRG
jgi:hypothetical protein